MPTVPDKLHLGCGLTTPEGWLNVDGSLNAKAAKHPRLRSMLTSMGFIPREATGVKWSTNVFIHDVRTPLPWRDGSFKALYASHLLEHLHLNEARRLLAEGFRVLAPGGVIRIVVPDLEAFVKDYFAGRRRPDLSHVGNLTPGDDLNSMLHFHAPDPPRGNFVLRTYRLHNSFHQHKWMYDAPSLIARLTEAGFRDAERRQCFESRIEGIREIEKEPRVVDGGLAVEAVKPGAPA